jgi:hypothetical protein
MLELWYVYSEVYFDADIFEAVQELSWFWYA